MRLRRCDYRALIACAVLAGLCVRPRECLEAKDESIQGI